MSLIQLTDLAWATLETLYMVFSSTLCAFILGLPLGILLYLFGSIKPSPHLFRFLTILINIARSIPFIILLVALIPVTRFLIGTSIGINAAIVPLSLGAAPFFARLVHNVFETLPTGLIETGHSMGTTTAQMFRYILIPEALPGIIQAITMTAITLVNYSAMAGTVGGGGLGDLAIRYGYQRFDLTIMLSTIAILVALVQLLQAIGDRTVRKLIHH